MCWESTQCGHIGLGIRMIYLLSEKLSLFINFFIAVYSRIAVLVWAGLLGPLLKNLYLFGQSTFHKL